VAGVLLLSNVFQEMKLDQLPLAENALEARGTLGQILALVVDFCEIAVNVIYILLIVDGVLQRRNVSMWRISSLEDAKKQISALATVILVAILVSITHIANGAILVLTPRVKILMPLVQELVTILVLVALASTTQIALLAKRLTTANGVTMMVDHVNQLMNPLA